MLKRVVAVVALSMVALVLLGQTVLPGGYIVLPNIANASLLSCDALHQGALAYDTTNGCATRCNGTTWACLPTDSTGVSDEFMTLTDPIVVQGTTADIVTPIGPTKSAMTLQDCSFQVGPAVGGGTGTLTTKLCSAASGGGTCFATFSIACNAAIGATGACTITTAAVPAGTTLHYSSTGACSTADVNNVTYYHFSQP